MFLSKEDGNLFVVETAPQQAIGYAAISRGWNDYAVIDDIAIDVKHRGKWAARLLMNEAVLWAKTRDLFGVSLETQNNNIVACRFYEQYGFQLAGFDRLIYAQFKQQMPEIALFYYLLF